MRLLQSIDSQVRTCNEILDALNYLNDFSGVSMKNAPEDWGDHIMFIEDERDRLLSEAPETGRWLSRDFWLRTYNVEVGHSPPTGSPGGGVFPPFAPLSGLPLIHTINSHTNM